MAKSPWLPVITALVVIIASSIIVRPVQSSRTKVSKLPTPTSVPSPKANPTIIPTIIEINQQDYMATYAKCGEIPYLPELSQARFAGNFSKIQWSPSCRFVAWSASIKNSLGPWQLSPSEGLFIYDLKTKKITRIYEPKSDSDSVLFQGWQDDTHLIFHQDLNNIDYIYNLSTKTFY